MMRYITILMMFFTLMLSGCIGDKAVVEKNKLPSINDVPESAWKKLEQKKIYFGHQSVGNNILDGINKITSSNKNLNINIQATTDTEAFGAPILAHSAIGRNDDVDSKLKSFMGNMQSGLGNKVDIAFMKLCYWDVRRHTNVEEVFQNYKATINKLKKEYPNVTFIHWTVPLMNHSNGIVANIKRLVRPDNGDLDNIKRNELNKLITQEYSGKEPLFDVAKVESTLTDGSRTAFKKDDNIYFYLPSVYTYDGGHLNDDGRKHVAEQLLIFLSQVVDK